MEGLELIFNSIATISLVVIAINMITIRRELQNSVKETNSNEVEKEDGIERVTVEWQNRQNRHNKSDDDLDFPNN